jgi:hypothetical protein
MGKQDTPWAGVKGMPNEEPKLGTPAKEKTCVNILLFLTRGILKM